MPGGGARASGPAVQPTVPDYELLRVVGRGAYGEIWLARGRTGALRAVKIVHRSTFDSESSFHREFSGMSAFEPISRSHDGFVDILHVGKNDAGGFFHYVMELADDHVAGQPIDLSPDPKRTFEHYLPKTLKSEIDRCGRLPVAECIRIGLSLTSALEVLHGHGLAHRDIKPANIIFVRGAPKLADIGLVASTGQRSFVGTEGFVPAEGPGTPQADLYSLGKVLYTAAMGKDRMEFPELATDLSAFEDKAQLMQLNEIVLKACANDAAERYESAQAMREDLLRLQHGEPLRRRRCRVLPWAWLIRAMAVLCVFFGAVLGFFALQRWQEEEPGAEARGAISVRTEPEGARVMLGDLLRTSPVQWDDVEPGRYTVRVMLPGHEPIEKKIRVKPGRTLELPFSLRRSHGSIQLDATPPGGAAFELRASRLEAAPTGGSAADAAPTLVRTGTTPATVSDLPTGRYEVLVRRDGAELREAVEVTRNQTAKLTFSFALRSVNITSDPPGVMIAVDGKPQGAAPLALQLIAGTHEVVASHADWPEQRRQLSLPARDDAPGAVHFEFLRGSVKITSSPSGAAVMQAGEEIGRTPLLVEDLKPGVARYELQLAGYKPAEISCEIHPKQQTFVGARLEKKLGPQPGQPWVNSLGMRFLMVGSVRFSAWETRVCDYEAFCKATGRTRAASGFPQTDEHPVVQVNWHDANAFCEWLTEKERREHLLDETQRYRLPTDVEWSAAVGLPAETGATPEARDGKIRDEFPWGKQWPPTAAAGNYADGSPGRRTAAQTRRATLENPGDGYTHTAPAGGFPPNAAGLHDLGGNVWEWCQDSYKGGSEGDSRTRDWGVLRGGSWADNERGKLLSAYRNVVDRNERDVLYGFRCVLASDE